MTAEDQTRLERWRYLGRRELHKGGLGARYQLPDGEVVLFGSKRPPAVVGGIYELTVAGDGDTLTIHGAARFLEAPSADDPDVAVLEAEDRAALAADSLRKLEAKAQAQSAERFAQITLAELRELYARTPHPRRAPLLAQVIRQITST